MLQCFVRTADLDKIYAAEEKILAGANVNAMKLEAFKYYYAPAGATGVAGICAKPTPEILKLQADIIAAAKPFTVETGPIGAFTASHGDPATDAALIQYVSTFVPKMTGERFNPHVSTGVASREYLDKMLAEPFESFTFSPAGAAVYQLGPFGTAAKKLKTWELKPEGPRLDGDHHEIPSAVKTSKPSENLGVFQKLLGQWVRPDGGYILDIKSIGSDGKIEMAYLNPNLIHVSKAQASIKDGKLELFIELRDTGYPGNYYTLAFDEQTDKLVGIYHHLGIGQDFDVYFVRQ
jgi:hypothetical protein